MDELPYDIKYLILKRYIKDLNIRILFGNLKFKTLKDEELYIMMNNSIKDRWITISYFGICYVKSDKKSISLFIEDEDEDITLDKIYIYELRLYNPIIN